MNCVQRTLIPTKLSTYQASRSLRTLSISSIRIRLETNREDMSFQKNEIKLTIQEMHCEETAGHLGTDKTIEKIKSRFFWISLNRDVRKFIKECKSCQNVKPAKSYCKPKLMPLAPTRTLMVITMDTAGRLPETPRGNRLMLAICGYFIKYTNT